MKSSVDAIKQTGSAFIDLTVSLATLIAINTLVILSVAVAVSDILRG